MDNEICEARVGSSRHAAWVLHVIRFGFGAAPVANIAHEFRHGCGACGFCSRDKHIDESLIRAHETRILKLMYPVLPAGLRDTRPAPYRVPTAPPRSVMNSRRLYCMGGRVDDPLRHEVFELAGLRVEAEGLGVAALADEVIVSK
jgi:hypothetical protein